MEKADVLEYFKSEIARLEAEKSELATLKKMVKMMEGSDPSNPRKQRAPMSEESRQRVAAAQKLRWEKVRAAQKKAAKK
jgi:hypothetical protein